MDPYRSSTGDSPRVRLWLEYGEHTLQLRQVAPDWIIPASPVTLAPGEAIIVTEIEDRQYRRAVTLTEGIAPDADFVPIRDNPAEPGHRALAV